MATQSTTINKKSATGSVSSKGSKASETKNHACRVILTPTKKSTLGRARIKAAVAMVYGKNSK